MRGVPVAEVSRGLRSLPGGGHAVRVETLAAPALLRLREPLIAVAAQAFAAPLWSETPGEAVQLVDRMWLALGRPDFTAAVAFADKNVIGFAYGHTDTFCTAFLPGRENTEAFELIELAVAPAYQGLGVGRALHDAVLAAAAATAAAAAVNTTTADDRPRLLLTHPEAPARRRYLHWGWVELGTVPIAPDRQLLLMQYFGS